MSVSETVVLDLLFGGPQSVWSSDPRSRQLVA